MAFIGRKREVEWLKKELGKPGLVSVLLYGKRQIGKTELIKYVLSEMPSRSVYYQCKQVAVTETLADLTGLLKMHFPTLAHFSFSSLESAFRFVFEQKGLVLVLDEFNYLLESDPSIESVLQSLIDQYRDSSDLKIIISGSAVKMLSRLSEYGRPLYGRLKSSLFLKELDYREAALFYPAASLTDKVAYWSAFGGEPFILRLIDDSKTFDENLREIALNDDAPLGNFVAFLMVSEFVSIKGANDVILALARGFSKAKDLADQAHISPAQLAYIINKLIDLDLVERRSPIDDETNKKKTFYQFRNNLLNFYFRYVGKNLSYQAIMNPEDFYHHFIEADFHDKYVPKIFGRMARDFLIMRNKAGQIKPPLLKVGVYWADDPVKRMKREFDVVTYDELGYTFYEVKYRDRKLGMDVVSSEKEQISSLGITGFRQGFFSKSGFEGIKGEYPCYSLEDMYR